MLITERNWKQWSSNIAAPAEPEEYDQAAVERLMNRMEEYVVRVKGVHPQFRAHNFSQLIDFESAADRDYYHQAWERYLIEKAKIEGMEGLSASQSRFMILVQFLKFRQAAELVRAPHLAKAMWQSVNSGNAAVCVTNFRPTITRACSILLNDYNISRDKISLIWGGSQVKQTKKGEMKKTILENEELLDLLEANGISLDSINLGDSVEVKEEVEFAPHLRMGAQNLKQRQFEIDQFQAGNSLFCFFTFKAGGVGLSLHHTDEFTKFKCRRKESGYVFEEDIPQVFTRPREVFLAPTYSAIELVQGLGRCPRLTSLSDTKQLLIFYRGTIEERVKAITDAKLRCLAKVVRTGNLKTEHWEDIVTARDRDNYYRKQQQQIQDQKPDDSDEDDGIMGEDIGENGGDK